MGGTEENQPGQRALLQQRHSPIVLSRATARHSPLLCKVLNLGKDKDFTHNWGGVQDSRNSEQINSRAETIALGLFHLFLVNLQIISWGKSGDITYHKVRSNDKKLIWQEVIQLSVHVLM